jgi:hypothetical protein
MFTKRNPDPMQSHQQGTQKVPNKKMGTGHIKKSPRTLIQRCYIFDTWRSFSTAWMLWVHVYGTWVIFILVFFLPGLFQYSSLEFCLIILRICGLLINCVFKQPICDMQASKPLISFQNSILFSFPITLFNFNLHNFFVCLKIGRWRCV